MATSTPVASAPALGEPVVVQQLAFSTMVGQLVPVMDMLQRIAPVKVTLPILAGVLIKATPEGLTLMTSNIEIDMAGSIADADVDLPGSACVDARRFTEWLKLQDEDTRCRATFDKKTKRLIFKAGTSKLELATWEEDDFPNPPDDDSTKPGVAALPASQMYEAFDQVVSCVAPDDTRPVLAGMLFDLDKKSVTFAAADGFRLAVRVLDRVGRADAATTKAIIPGKAIVELLRLLKPTDNEDKASEARTVQVLWWPTSATASRHRIAFRFNGYTLRTRTIDGQFPDYMRIVPNPDAIRNDLQLATKPMRNAARAAGLMARDNSNIMRLVIHDDRHLLVRGLSAEMGNVEDLVPYESITKSDNEFEIAFNARYVTDLLAHMPDAFRFQTVSKTSPGVFRPVGQYDGLLYVVMPMHVVK